MKKVLLVAIAAASLMGSALAADKKDIKKENGKIIETLKEPQAKINTIWKIIDLSKEQEKVQDDTGKLKIPNNIKTKAGLIKQLKKSTKERIKQIKKEQKEMINMANKDQQEIKNYLKKRTTKEFNDLENEAQTKYENMYKLFNNPQPQKKKPLPRYLAKPIDTKKLPKELVKK